MPSSEDDIQILIGGCLKNDRKAQEQLYKKFYHAMMALCVRYTKDKNDALEILNDGFLKVFKNIGQYDAAKASLYTWMRKIIINTAIDFLRKKQVYYDMDVLLDAREEAGIENEALFKMSGEELLAAIRQLPATTCTVFNLYVIEGFSHREIAAMLEISEGTSRWHLSEARRQLKIIIHLMETNP
ncbi:MAG: RNA polymerase sigma factor [Chitinophaga rupis]